MATTVFTSSDAAWAWPAGVTTLVAEAIGGGGAGGGETGNPAGGGGGKGGSYSRVTLTKGVESTLNITVGAGGTAGSGAHGGSGAATTIVQNGSTVLRAGGGEGGKGGTTSAYHAGGTVITDGATGSGGTPSTTTNVGDVTWEGGNGAAGVDGAPDSSGAGGGAAGPDQAGGAASVITAGTASNTAFRDGTIYGGDGGAGRATTENNGVGGQASPYYGGAGSGGLTVDATNHPGGAGRPGVVVLTYVGDINVSDSISTNDSAAIPSEPRSVNLATESASVDDSVQAAVRFATFADARASIVNGLVSAQSDTLGWNEAVLPAILADLDTYVTRDSDTQVTITIPAMGGAFDITQVHVVTGTVPVSAVQTSTTPIVASPTFSILNTIEASVADTATVADSAVANLRTYVSASDSVSASDATTGLVDAALSLSDSVDAGESVPTPELEEAEPEPLAVENIGDTAFLDDSTSVEYGTYLISVSDAASAEDAGSGEVGTIPSLEVSTSDTVTVADRSLEWSDWSDVLEFSTIEPDLVTLSDSASALLDLLLLVSDGISSADAATALAEIVLSASDQASVQDSSTARLDRYLLSVADSITAEDDTNVVPEALVEPVTLSVSDQITVADRSLEWSEWSDTLEFSTIEPDVVTIQDAASVQLDALYAQVSDVISQDDSLSVLAGGDLVIDVVDAVSLLDADTIRKISTVFDVAVKTDIILGLISAQSDTNGWNEAVITALLADPDTYVTRDSDTQVTVDIPPVATFDITQQHIVTAYVPSSAVVSGEPIVAAPVFLIDQTAEVSVADTLTFEDAREVNVAGEPPAVSPYAVDSVSAQEAVAGELTGPLSVSATDTVSANDDLYTWSEWSEEWEFTTGTLEDTATFSDSSDAEVQGGDIAAQPSDTATLQDSISARLDLLLVSKSDTMTVSDAPILEVSGSVQVSLSDTITEIADSISASLDKLVAVKEDVASVSDSAAVILAELIVSLSDTLETSEVIQRSITTPGEVGLFDRATVADGTQVQLEFLQAAVSDSVDASDSLEAALDVLLVNVSDLASATESVVTAFNLFVAKSDTATVADSATAFLPVLVVSTGDVVSAADATEAFEPVLNALAEEVANVSDAAYAALDFIQFSIEDTIIAADAVTPSSYDSWVELVAEDTLSVLDTRPVRTMPDDTKALGMKSTGPASGGHTATGPALGHKSRNVDYQ